ncbi:hypothetical protein [Chryseobacterium binzhouense]|uniref:hypothetical protein n=1 Tax=Chryseobacterium binzhouense TaxID=2593646 RepID=UPI0011810923|nr:hypothetical protein [Chryseobacterium binzhouense]
MKKYIFIFTLATCAAHAQVAIGKSSVTPGASLEFGNSGNTTDLNDISKQKALVLPWITDEASVASGSVPGTLIYDIDAKKVKLAVATAENSTTISIWRDLTVATDGVVDPSLQNATGITEKPTAKVSIGKTPSSIPGVLVLEDTDKAMILPLVKDYKSVITPEPGAIVYDTTNNMFCVYNGKNWTFWSAQ